MSNLQLIEELCRLVELMSGIIRTLATELELTRSLSDSEIEAVNKAHLIYTQILGSDEWPDEF